MKYKYTVKLYNDFTAPYFFAEDREQCNHISFEQYTFSTIDMCRQCVKDFLDVPEAELTFEEVKKDWSDHKYPISDEKLKEIQAYYNGRLDIYNKVLLDLAAVESYGIDGDSIELRYDIPHKFNEFVTDENEKLSIQNEAYLLIRIETES